MKYNLLGRTGLKVSELCFGVLPMGPLQTNVAPMEGGDLILEGMQNGINFFDTAQMYRTYPHLRHALDNYHNDVIITSKSTAADYAGMEAAIQEALKELNRDYIDIFLLHAARVEGNPIEKRPGAWECLMDYKQKGCLRAIGASTHAVSAVQALTATPEVDVIFALLNKASMGIIGGNADEMKAALLEASAAGKGIYSMKLLAGGSLLDQICDAIAYGRAIPELSAHAVGMVRKQELELNLRIFNDEAIPPEELSGLKYGKKWALMSSLCRGCGHCINTCPSFALSMQDGKPAVDESKCLLCGYCAADCPEFAIRVK